MDARSVFAWPTTQKTPNRTMRSRTRQPAAQPWSAEHVPRRESGKMADPEAFAGAGVTRSSDRGRFRNRRLLEVLPREEAEERDVTLAGPVNDLVGQGRDGGLLVPADGLEVVPHELLVEGRRGSTR